MDTFTLYIIALLSLAFAGLCVITVLALTAPYDKGNN